MVMKTFIAATCVAALAGGMVYFGTQPANTAGKVKIVQTTDVAVEGQSKDIYSKYIGPEKNADETSTANQSSDEKVDRRNRPESPQAEKAKKPKSKNGSAVTLRIEAAFEQAERITNPTMRDQAYLGLSDFATSKGLFDEALKAALKIEKVDWRDTARSRIAMQMARVGQADDAFELIDQVEVKELRDVMRLQVIEALLGTEPRR